MIIQEIKEDDAEAEYAECDRSDKAILAKIELCVDGDVDASSSIEASCKMLEKIYQKQKDYAKCTHHCCEMLTFTGCKIGHFGQHLQLNCQELNKCCCATRQLLKETPNFDKNCVKTVVELESSASILNQCCRALDNACKELIDRCKDHVQISHELHKSCEEQHNVCELMKLQIHEKNLEANLRPLTASGSIIEQTSSECTMALKRLSSKERSSHQKSYRKSRESKPSIFRDDKKVSIIPKKHDQYEYHDCVKPKESHPCSSVYRDNKPCAQSDFSQQDRNSSSEIILDKRYRSVNLLDVRQVKVQTEDSSRLLSIKEVDESASKDLQIVTRTQNDDNAFFGMMPGTQVEDNMSKDLQSLLSFQQEVQMPDSLQLNDDSQYRVAAIYFIKELSDLCSRIRKLMDQLCNRLFQFRANISQAQLHQHVKSSHDRVDAQVDNSFQNFDASPTLVPTNSLNLSDGCPSCKFSEDCLKIDQGQQQKLQQLLLQLQQLLLTNSELLKKVPKCETTLEELCARMVSCWTAFLLQLQVTIGLHYICMSDLFYKFQDWPKVGRLFE